VIKLSKRGLGITLIVSLAVNLFLVGMIVTAVLFKGHAGGWAGDGRPFPHWIARRALEGESRRKVDAIWREARPGLHMRVREMRRSRRDIRRLLHADAIDRPALDKAFAGMRANMAGTHDAIQRVMGRIAETLNAEERRGYFRRHHWRRHRRFRRPAE
jgi:uncharacterized membrane protein